MTLAIVLWVVGYVLLIETSKLHGYLKKGEYMEYVLLLIWPILGIFLMMDKYVFRGILNVRNLYSNRASRKR